MSAKPTFQLNAKTVLLTYPKAGFPLFEYLAWARTLPNFIYGTVAAELHEDNSPHRHALLQFSKPVRSRDPKVFDYKGFHCNVQGARSPIASKTYVQKDGNFLEEGQFVEARARVGEKEVVLAGEIQEKAQAMTLGEFLCWSSENRVMYAKDIWQAYAKKDTTTILDNSGYDSALLDPAFLAMMNNELDKGIPREKALVLVGASGIGKTVLAKKMVDKPALFVSHIDQLKTFRPDYHKGIVFDDVSFKHTPITNQIGICDYDNPRAIHCRHTVANIPARIMKIFTCNEAPLELEHEAIARRVTLIQCNHGHLNKYRDALAKKIN